MAKKTARLILTLIGAAIGAGLVVAVDSILISLGYLGLSDVMYTWGVVLIYVAAGILTAIIFYLISPRLIDAFAAVIGSVESRLSAMALDEIFFSVVGLIVGLIVAFLLSTLTVSIGIRWLRFILNVALYVFLGYLGWSAVAKRKGEIVAPQWLSRTKGRGAHTAKPKLLDTSVIIDGRIRDVCATGVIEGTLVVPAFVVQELQHIADSSDSLKRNRGRRGLDILKELQDDKSLHLHLVNNDYNDIAEVDAKLIRLAAEMGGVVVTNDYNLNKVAAVNRVPVLNINELANALKPIALPGEEMVVTIVKEGKESGQGVAYMEDGTMIVVDGARKLLGESVQVVVTSALQTAAGRMVFAKLR